MKHVETFTISQDSTPFQLTIDIDSEKVQVPKYRNHVQSYHDHTVSFPAEASKDLDSRARVSTRANFTNYKWLVEMTAQIDSKSMHHNNIVNFDNGTEFKRYENVVIATKVHWPKDLKILKRMLCLLKAAYNRFVNYDILVFTTIPWSEEQVLELAEVVAPAKLIVALDGPSLEEQLQSMTDDEVTFLQVRCGAENSTLTWMHYCQEENSRHTSNLAYAWQSEFRAYHIWKHPSIQPYKFMMWIDSDALCSKTWERDPMKLMVENNLTILFDNFPGGSLKGDDLVERLMKGYDTSICWIALNEEGSWKLRLCKENTRGTLVPQVHGFFHITNMDVYRSPRHYNFLKLLVGEYRFSRKWDDQLAVTIPAAMEDHTRAWDLRLHNISLMIRHNFCYDGKLNEKYNYRKPIKWWKNEGRYAWEAGRLLCDQCVLDVPMKAGLVFSLCCTVWYIDITHGFSTRRSVAFNAKQEMLIPSTKLLTRISKISRKDMTQRPNGRTLACVLSASNYDEEDSAREEYDKNDSDADEQESDISWLREAMSNDVPSELLSTAKDNYTSKLPKFESGLAGFAVDPELGFVSILLGEEARPDKFTFAIMSPTDINNVSSAEALCLVQLAGGLDLGAAVFPPEALARIVSEALEESDEDAEMLPFDNVEALRPRVSLLGVTVKKNENYSPNEFQESNKSKEYELSNQNSVAVSSAAREKAIQVSAPKILSAVKNLPGLAKVTISDILEALKLHSDNQGNLNREEFSQVLGTLRYRLSRTMINDQRVKFQITVSISSNSGTSKDTPGLKLMNIDDVPAFLAVALSLRYKVKISVSNDCLSQEDHDKNNVMNRFPAFKSIQELEKDAQSISGSIASMFFKQSASDNDDKS